MKEFGMGFGVVLLLLIFAIFVPKACQQPDAAIKVLQDNGYTDIRITGYRWFTCDEKDTFSTGFIAITPTGKQVSGAVCSGFFKGNTIRFD